MRYINDLHGKHSWDTCGQHKAPEIVLTTCKLKLRKQCQNSTFDPYFCGVLPLPLLLTRTSSPPNTAESCLSTWNAVVIDDHSEDKQVRENLHTASSARAHSRRNQNLHTSDASTGFVEHL